MAGNGPEVGSGHVSLFPVMTGFKAAVSKEIQAAGRTGGSVFSASFKGVGSKTGTSLGRGMKNAFTGAAGTIAGPGLRKLQSEVAAASRALSAARLKQQDAAGRVTVAEARLASAIERNGEGSARAVAAAESLASAKRRERSASESLAGAESRLKDAKESLASVDRKVVGGAERIKQAFTSLGRAAGPAMTSAVNTVGKAAGTISSKTTKILRTGLTAAGGLAAAGLGVALATGFSRLNALDQAKAKLSGLGNSAEQVGAILADALASVKGTAFGLDEAATTAAGAVAAGITPGERLRAVLKGVANVAAATGGTMQETGAIFNKVAATGHAYTEDINQLADRGLPIWQALADQLGVTTDQVRDMASSGKIDFRTFSDAAAKAAGTVSDTMGGTLTGSLKNLRASIGRIGANLEQGIFPKLAPLIQAVTKALSPLEGRASDLGALIGDKLAPKFEALSKKIERFPNLLDKAFTTSGRADIARSIGLDKGTTGNLKNAFRQVKDGAKTVGDALAGLSRDSGKAGGTMPVLTRAVNGIAAALKLVSPLLPPLGKLIELFGKLPSNVQTAGLGLALFGGQLKPLLTPISLLGSLVKGLGSVLKPAASAIGGFLSRKLFDATPAMNAAKSLEDVGQSAKDTAGKIGRAGKSAGGSFSGISGAALGMGAVVAGAFVLVGEEMDNARRNMDSLGKAMQQGSGAVQQYWASLKNGGGDYQLSWWDKLTSLGRDHSLSDTLRRTGTDWETFQNAVEHGGGAMEQVTGRNKLLVGGLDLLTGGLFSSVTGLGTQTKAAKDLRKAYVDATRKATELANSQESISRGFSDASSRISDLSTTLKANGDNLRDNGQLTQQSSEYLQSAAKSALASAKAQVAYGKSTGDTAGSVQQAKNEIQKMRDSLVEQLQGFGMSKDAAERYADQLGLIPSSIDTDTFMNTEASTNDLNAYLERMGATPSQKRTVMDALTKDADGNVSNLHLKIDQLPTWVQSVLTADNNDAVTKSDRAKKKIEDLNGKKAKATIEAQDNASGTIGGVYSRLLELVTHPWQAVVDFVMGKSSGGPVRRAAGGGVHRPAPGGPCGMVAGPGTATSDSIPALLSDGEFVMAAAPARRIGYSRLEHMNRTGEVPPARGTDHGSPVVYQVTQHITTVQDDPRRQALAWGRYAARAFCGTGGI